MAKMYYEKDCDLNKLTGKTVAVIGYGSQGHAHALNLRDSGVDVIVGLRKGGKSWPVAVKDGFDVMTVPEAAQKADIIMILINDERQAEMYKQDIAPYLTEGKAIAFAHGFNIRYKQIVPPAGVDVFMAAPKGPGHTVRSTYVVGKGVPCLVAVEQDASGHCLDTALAYIAGIGGARGHHGDDHARRDRDRPVRRAGSAVRRCFRADPRRFRYSGRGWLRAGDGLLRDLPRDEADR